MKVFVSHKREDVIQAASVADALRRAGHEVYLDLIDTNIGKDGDDLGDYLRARLAECQSLIAVISQYTRESQWVPWEIGVATEKGYPLSTYVSDSSTPPEFLRKWPVLRTMSHVAQFAARAKEFEETLIRKNLWRSIDRVTLSEKAATDERKATAADFHKSLKKSIGQA